MQTIDVVQRRRVLEHAERRRAGHRDTHLLGGGRAVGQQQLPVCGVGPGAGDHAGTGLGAGLVGLRLARGELILGDNALGGQGGDQLFQRGDGFGAGRGAHAASFSAAAGSSQCSKISTSTSSPGSPSWKSGGWSNST